MLPARSPTPSAPSNRPKTSTRSSVRTPRWMSVKPETSSTELLTPVTNKATRATAASGHAPIRTSGRPHIVSAIATTAGSRLPPARPSAPNAPTSPPRPIAAFSSPTPVSPMPRNPIDATTMSVMSRPRTKTCATKVDMRSVVVGYRLSRRAASATRKREAPSSPAPGLASAARSNRIPVTTAAAPANAAATRTAVAADPVVATTMLASSGPRNVPRPSPRLEATFAATSSPGLRANAGKSAVWMGRTRAPAPATNATSTNVEARGSSIAITSAVSRAPRQRARLTTVRTRLPPKRSTSTGANGAATIAGRTRTAPRTPDPEGARRVVRDDEHEDEEGPVCGRHRPSRRSRGGGSTGSRAHRAAPPSTTTARELSPSGDPRRCGLESVILENRPKRALHSAREPAHRARRRGRAGHRDLRLQRRAERGLHALAGARGNAGKPVRGNGGQHQVPVGACV